MKKILLTLSGFLLTMLAIAQSPNLMNYQGVARNGIGNVLPLQPISLRLSVLNGSAAGPAVYVETRNVTTNAFGLFNVIVGGPGATSTTGTIAGINWTAFGTGSGSKFLQVEIDPAGGSSYFNVGVTQMVSVPYALNAGAAAPVGPAGGDLTGTYPNPQILFPLIKTFSYPTTQLVGMTNSSTTGTLGAITGASASNDANAAAITGTMSSTSPGANGSGVKGVSNGTGSLGIGVSGLHAASGWGVWGLAPSGIGVVGQSTSGTAVFGSSSSGVGVWGGSNTSNAGQFVNSNTANTADALAATSNGVGNSVSGINTGTGRGGFFQVNNAASTANALEVTTNGTGASWGIRANSTGTNGAGLFVQSNATNTSNNVQSNQAGLGRAGLFQNTNTANTADALMATTNTTSITPSAMHGINGSSGISVGAKKGTWGESDNGIGVFGSSTTSTGVNGVSGFGTGVGVSALTFGTGAAFSGTSLSGRAADLTLAAGNASTVLNASTAGTGGAGTFSNTNTANTSNVIMATNENILGGATGPANGGGASLFARKGAALVNHIANPTSVYATVADPASGPAGIASLGMTNNGFGVVGIGTGSGTAVLGQAAGTGIGIFGINTSTGYGLVTFGKVQIQGQGAGINRVLTSNNVGDATWNTLSSVGGVSGTGTLNYMTKWTPDGTTVGNSLLFDNGTNIGFGTTAPNGRLDIANASNTARGLMVNNTNASNASSTIYAQTSNVSGSPTIESAAITAAMAPFGVGTTVSTLTTPVALKSFAAPANVVGAAGGTAIQGATSGGYGVVGLSNDGVSLLGWSLGGGHALQTSGKVQISGQGAALNRILRSDATGNATWETLATVGAVAGTGTLNTVPKWTPDGVTIGNSRITENGAYFGFNSAVNRDPFGENGMSLVSSTSTRSAISLYNNFNASAVLGGVDARDGAFKGLQVATWSNHAIGFYTGGNWRGIWGSNGNFGINTPLFTDPTAKLEVIGNVKITDGTQAAGRVLASDGVGNASWQDLITPDVHMSAGSTTAFVTVPASTNTNITTQWGGLDEGGGANYNPLTGEYTISVAGYYSVFLHLTWNDPAPSSGAGLIFGEIKLNGGSIARSYSATSIAGNIPDDNHAQVERRFNVGDIIRFAAFQNTTGPMNLVLNNNACKFGIHLIHK